MSLSFPPLFPSAIDGRRRFLHPAFGPLEFTGKQEQTKRNENHRGSGSYDHHKTGDKKDSPDNTHDDFPNCRMKLIEPQPMPHLLQQSMYVLLTHVPTTVLSVRRQRK